MWNTHSHSFKKFLLWNEIISDLEFYKQYSKIGGTQSTINCKMSIDGKIVRGTFVFNLISANIFIRYKRKCGGKLPLFNWTLKKIADLGKRQLEIINEVIVTKPLFGQLH